MSTPSGVFKGFTKKQLEVLRMPFSKIMILHGPVRSGKTVAANARLMQHAIMASEKSNNIQVSVAAKSIANCHRNVAGSMRECFGRRIVPPTSDKSDSFIFKVDNGFSLQSVGARCLGWSTVRAENSLYGWNIDGSLIDEVVMAPENLFSVNITRLDRPRAGLVCTTNPQSNRHWLKKNFIDKADGKYVSEIAWKLDDNPMLSRDYREMLERTLHGVYYRRLVLGEWCSADGMIYPFLNESYVMNRSKCATGYIVGLDFGARKNFAAVLVGYNGAETPAAWVEEDFKLDGDGDEFLTINEMMLKFWDWIGGRSIEAIYVDPSCRVFKNELAKYNHRQTPVIDAENDVTNGIHCVMSMLSTREVAIGRKCQKLLDELYQYCWDAKKSDSSGDDVPAKENDHLCDALRYALYSRWGDTCEVHRFTSPKKINIFGVDTPPRSHISRNDLSSYF